MTAGTELVCNDVVHKVEIAEKCVAGLDMNGVNEVGDVATVNGDVGGNGNGNVGGAGKDEYDDSSYVFVNGGIEVAAGDPGDSGGGDVDIAPKSDSADEGDLFKKEELGIENGGTSVDPLVLKTNGFVHEPATVSDDEVMAVKDDLHLENGSTVDPLVVSKNNDFTHDLNGHLDKIIGDTETVVESVDEVEDANEITNVEAKTDDIVSVVTLDHQIESSQVTINESLSSPDVINTADEVISTPDQVQNPDCEVMVNDEQEYGKPSEDLECEITADVSESSGSKIKKQEGQSTVDESGNPSEDLGCEITADVSESSGSQIKEQEGQSSVDESVKSSEDLGSQVTADEPESCENPIKEQESEVLVDESEPIGCLVDNQESPVLVDESAPNSNHVAEFDSNMIVMESNEKPDEHQEVVSLNSEVSIETEPNLVCSDIKSEQQSDLVSDSYPIEHKNSEETEIGSLTESEVNPNSEIELSENADVWANGKVEKFEGILADESELVVLNGEKEKPEENLEKRLDGSSETPEEITESVNIVTNFEEIKEQVKMADDIQESQIVVTDNVQDDLNLENNTTESANEAEVSLETETNTESITHENTVSEYEVSNCIDKPQEDFQPEESVEIVENSDPVKSECKNGVELVAHVVTENGSDESMDCATGIETVDSVPDDEEKENEIKDAPVESVAHQITENGSAEVVDSGTVIENVVVLDNEEKETEVKDALIESAPDLVTNNRSAECIDSETMIEKAVVPDNEEKEAEVKDAPVESVTDLITEKNKSAECVDSETVIENVDVSADEEKETEVKDAPVIEFGSFGHHETTIPDIHNDDAISVIIEDKNSDKMWSQEVEEIEEITDAIEVQDEETEVLAYNFLIRIPRFEDESFRDQIRSAQLQVEEKTRIRDSVRVEIQNKRAKMRAHNEAFNAARAEETAARKLVRLKRQEIDSVQVVVNRLKNAMSVEDIDSRIFNTEHMIQHETLILRDEKQFIREIKQLKTLRDQLASNMGTPEEIRQAIDQKDQNEERMKTLRKELDSLKDKVSKAEAVVKAVRIKYDAESRKERELQTQFRAADDVRQKAYAHLYSLKKLSYEKNKDFRLYKDNVMAARDFASRGDKDALHRLCANQVEAFMEQWNNNDEFRKDYVNRCNMVANRRQRALEGAPDDVAPVGPSDVSKKVEKSLVSTPSEVESVTVVSTTEQENVISTTENKHADNNNNNININIRSIEIVSGQKNDKLKSKVPAKATLGGDVAKVAELATDDKEEEENKLTKEETELARKAEELRKEEIAAKLKEEKRLEEKAKAVEALERKKRIAEKAQIRAEMRARKEAEQKEKEKEKRLRKKEKKKTGGNGDGSINGEEGASSESSNETNIKETETAIVKEKTKKKTQKPPPHFFSKQFNKPKPIPPPVINRNKKRWQQWGKFALVAALVLVLFLIGNTGFFLHFKVTKSENGAI